MANATEPMHYHVVAGLSEGNNFPTAPEAAAFANAQASTGLKVRVWAVMPDGEYRRMAWKEGSVVV